MPDPLGDREVDPYRVTAEFYDLHHYRRYRWKAQRDLVGFAAAARAGILEVGAGTGIVTEVLAEVASVPVHAVEPSRAMRSILLSRWSASAAMGRHVHIHSVPAERVRLADPVDLVVCVNLVGTLAPARRTELWTAMRAVLRPGGLLVLDRPATVSWQSRLLSVVEVGEACYRVSVTIHEIEGTDQQRWTYRYAVQRGDQLIREEFESFDFWPIGKAGLRASLATAGFTFVPKPTVPGSTTNGMLCFRC